MSHINTLLAHTAYRPDAETSAVIPPLHLATTYERAEDNTYPNGFQYARDGNPTRQLLEKTLSLLEGGKVCRAYASGMAACHAVLLALPAGAHIIIPDDVYHGMKHLVAREAENGRFSFSAVDMTDIESIKQVITPATRLIWVETPSNPLLKITDINTGITYMKILACVPLPVCGVSLIWSTMDAPINTVKPATKSPYIGISNGRFRITSGAERSVAQRKPS